MKTKNSSPLKNHLTSFFMGISLITIVLFGELLQRYFEYGLEDSVKMHLLAEWQGYQEELKLNPQTELPSSYIMSFRYDEPAEVLIDGQNVLEGIGIAEGEFRTVFVDETVTSDLEHEAVIGVYHFRQKDGKSVYGSIKYDLGSLSDKVDVWFHDRFKLMLHIAGIYIFFVFAALWYYSYRVGKKRSYLHCGVSKCLRMSYQALLLILNLTNTITLLFA
ncbi:hypothetical protein [Vibrio tapetis]|uniref:Sensor histidine kinase n=1 Tax=Vibrio tapetis subsp. tapetis TaxID=1671868 RepID=A0A2N8ZAK1_9VIBR